MFLSLLITCCIDCVLLDFSLPHNMLIEKVWGCLCQTIALHDILLLQQNSHGWCMYEIPLWHGDYVKIILDTWASFFCVYMLCALCYMLFVLLGVLIGANLYAIFLTCFFSSLNNGSMLVYILDIKIGFTNILLAMLWFQLTLMYLIIPWWWKMVLFWWRRLQ